MSDAPKGAADDRATWGARNWKQPELKPGLAMRQAMGRVRELTEFHIRQEGGHDDKSKS